MSKLYEHQDYEEALENFKSSNCKWNAFSNVQLKVSKDRCPICECDFNETITRLSNKGTTIIEKTIDHFRPQKHYSFLECEHTNYLLMCSECNNIYKGSEFPIYNNASRATKNEELESEKQLIVNPLRDNLLELFTLVFKRTSSGRNILELHPKQDSGYLFEKAKETIKLFGLGDCDTNRHTNENVYNCRISILESHYGVFYNFVTALKDGEKKKAYLELKKQKSTFEQYGFYEFIKKNQFEVYL